MSAERFRLWRQPARARVGAGADSIVEGLVVHWPAKTRYLLVMVCLLASFVGEAMAAHLAGGFVDAPMAPAGGFGSARPVANPQLASACSFVFACAKRSAGEKGPASNTGPQKNVAADRVEKLYNGFAVGTDAEGHEGYDAAHLAEEQLRLDFLSSFQEPQTNAANQTAWDQEASQLTSDSLKYAGDRTLDAAAMYWGVTYLSLPVTSPDTLLGQAKTIQVSDQPGEREFAEYMANYLAVRFDSLNRMASYYQTATDDIEQRHVPLDLADLQAELRIDEADRTRGRSKPF